MIVKRASPTERNEKFLEDRYTGLVFDCQKGILLHLARTLPKLSGGYELYVTIYNPANSIKSSLKSNCSVLISKKFLESYLQTFKGLQLVLDSKRANARVEFGEQESFPGKFGKIEIDSIDSAARNIELKLQGKISVDNLRDKIHGFKFNFQCPKGIPLSTFIRLQFIENKTGFLYFIPRIIEGDIHENFFVPLIYGENIEFSVDIGYILKEIAIEWFNNTQIHPEQPKKCFDMSSEFKFSETLDFFKNFSIEVKNYEFLDLPNQCLALNFQIKNEPFQNINNSESINLKPLEETSMAEIRIGKSFLETFGIENILVKLMQNPNSKLLDNKTEKIAWKEFRKLCREKLYQHIFGHLLKTEIVINKQKFIEYLLKNITTSSTNDFITSIDKIELEEVLNDKIKFVIYPRIKTIFQGFVISHKIIVKGTVNFILEKNSSEQILKIKSTLDYINVPNMPPFLEKNIYIEGKPLYDFVKNKIEHEISLNMKEIIGQTVPWKIDKIEMHTKNSSIFIELDIR